MLPRVRPVVRAMAAASAPDAFSMGPGTLSIARSSLHAPLRAAAVASARAALAARGAPAGLALLAGGGPASVYDTDMESVFRQEAYFQYLFGANEPGLVGTVDLRDGRATLYVPRPGPDDAVWTGPAPSLDEVAAKYAVDAAKYADALGDDLAAAPVVHVLDGTNTDSGERPARSLTAALEARLAGAGVAVEAATLHPVLTEQRVIKTGAEVEVMRHAARAAVAGIVAAMHAARPGCMEYQLEAEFLHTVYRDFGCRHAPYTPIVASGPNAAVLHYGHAGAPNDRQVGARDLVLMDCGAEYHGWDSDVTITFPAGGAFDDDQRAVYEAVLAARAAVLGAAAPGVPWPDMHALAERAILARLAAAGFVTGDLEAAFEADVGALFMPHGLGHLLGLDTHDVGGYSPSAPPRPSRPGACRLRTARTLAAGMVITLEPGCYFCAALLEPALEVGNPFLNAARVRAALDRGLGGVRLEDDVLITATGAEPLAAAPRSVAEVEAVLAGGAWPPREGAAA